MKDIFDIFVTPLVFGILVVYWLARTARQVALGVVMVPVAVGFMLSGRDEEIDGALFL